MAQPGVNQSKAELEAQLRDQLGFLEASSAAYDAGYTSEAKRLAVAVRVLVHDTPKSKSLLGLLDKKNGAFVSTAIPAVKGNLLGHQGLVLTAMTASGARYIAPLDEPGPSPQRVVEFDEWWERTVFADSAGNHLSRRSLVLAMANQDGGAHVDPKLNEFYRRISRGGALSVRNVTAGVEVPVTGIELAAVRQIAHELLKSLTPGYEKEPDLTDVKFLVAEPSFVKRDLDLSSAFDHNPRPPAKPYPKGSNPGRNQQCPCGSGKKFKRCHGK